MSGFVAILALLRYVECLSEIVPLRLGTDNSSVISESIAISEMYVPIFLTILSIVVLELLSVFIFEKNIL